MRQASVVLMQWRLPITDFMLCKIDHAEVTCAVVKVPMLACTGNHEIEAESDGKNSMFKSVQARWKVLPA